MISKISEGYCYGYMEGIKLLTKEYDRTLYRRAKEIARENCISKNNIFLFNYGT